MIKINLRVADIFPVSRLHATSDEMLHLDVLRFVASAGIVYHHSHQYFVPVKIREGVMIRTTGYALFVDMFFIISGYTISTVYQNRVNTFRQYIDFIIRRIGRLVPLHWLMIFINMAAWSLFVLLGIHSNHQPSFQPWCVFDTFILAHGLIDCGNGIYFNGPSWSISVEMVMYLTFPLLIAASRQGRVALTWLGLFFLVILLIQAYAKYPIVEWRHVRIDVAPGILRVGAGFTMGAVMYQWKDSIVTMSLPSSLFWMLLFVVITTMEVGAPQYIILALIYATIFAAISRDGTRIHSWVVRTLAPLGQLTYSLYMWHWFVILILFNVLGDKILHGRMPYMAGIAIFGYLGLFVVSVHSFLYIETPARRWIDRLSLAK